MYMYKKDSEISVLYLTMNPNRASTTVPTEGWIKSLRRKGLRPVVVSYQLGDFHKWLIEKNVPSYRVNLFAINRKNYLGFLWAVLKLLIIIKKHKIKIIHCNEQSVYYIGRVVARLCRIPIVVSIHYTINREFSKWAFKGKRQPDRIFFVSNSNMKLCRDAVTGIIPEDKLRVLVNGIDVNKLKPDKKLRKEFRNKYAIDSKIVVGCACAISPRKQLEHLFEAIKRIPDSKIKVIVTGIIVKGYERYADKLIAKSKKNLGEKLVHLGVLPQLNGLYNAMDIFVNTSKEEAFSISILEALAHGCPVIGYPSKGAVAEALIPGGGEIVEQDNVEALAATLKRWIRNPKMLKLARRSARKRALHYDYRNISPILWKEYQDILRK
jgi:glycosyltransferase involved in cell wall biosynthesis